MNRPSYNYKFVRIALKEGWSENSPKQSYQQIIHEHAKDGWRLVTIFAPATTGFGSASYFELIFESMQADG